MVVEALRLWCETQRFWPTRKLSVMLRYLQGRDSLLAAKLESFYVSCAPAHAIAFVDGVLELAGGRRYEISTAPMPV
jgi:hypothetical protein